MEIKSVLPQKRFVAKIEHFQKSAIFVYQRKIIHLCTFNMQCLHVCVLLGAIYIMRVLMLRENSSEYVSKVPQLSLLTCLAKLHIPIQIFFDKTIK